MLCGFLLGCAARVDNRDHDDAHGDCHEGSPQIVSHGEEAQATGGLGFQRGKARH